MLSSSIIEVVGAGVYGFVNNFGIWLRSLV
jgi:hypothetical protein